VWVVGPRGSDGKQARRTIAEVPTPTQFHDAGLLLQGQLAWTLSQARTLRCGRDSCNHDQAACWNWQGEPSVELWHLPSGDLVWRAADCRQLVVLAHLDRAITLHRDPAAPDDRRVVRVWAVRLPQ